MRKATATTSLGKPTGTDGKLDQRREMSLESYPYMNGVCTCCNVRGVLISDDVARTRSWLSARRYLVPAFAFSLADLSLPPVSVSQGSYIMSPEFGQSIDHGFVRIY